MTLLVFFTKIRNLASTKICTRYQGINFLPLCSAQTRTGMGHLRRPPGVELIPAVD
jgi:hypothetical protein